MSTKKQTPGLFADNKDVADLLISNESTFKRDKLRAIALQRGIILSSRESRVDLANYLSLLSFTRTELGSFVEDAAPAEKQAATTARSYDVPTDADAISDAVDEVKKKRAEHHESVTVRRDGNTIHVTVGYTEMNQGRNRLQQSSERSVSVELSPTKGGKLEVVSTSGAKAADVIEDIVNRIVGVDLEPPKPREIDLDGVRDPKKRTQLFLGLFKHLKDYKGRAVSDVRIHSVPEEPAEDDESGDDDEITPKKKMTKTENLLRQRLTNAVFHGEDLLETDIYKQLEREGYFITRMVWRAAHKSGGEVEFEASFSDAANARDFRYRVLTVADMDPTGKLSGHYRPDDARRRLLLVSLQRAAEASFAEVEASLSSDSGSAAQAVPKK